MNNCGVSEFISLNKNVFYEYSETLLETLLTHSHQKQKHTTQNILYIFVPVSVGFYAEVILCVWTVY